MIIRGEQMKAFDTEAMVRFEAEMLAHSKEFSPRLCEVLGDDQLRVAVHAAIVRAKEYGFTYRGPIRLFIEMMFLCGSAFDTDPQYAAAGEILRGPGDQMERAEQMHLASLDYLEAVAGPENANVRKALEGLSVLARKQTTFSANNLVEDMLQEMRRLFPEKASYVGEDGLIAVINEGRAEARTYGFPTTRGEVLMVVLKYAFGHGCTYDPLYPWIARTLKDPRIKNPAARAERLEKKSLTWLDHVLAEPAEAGRA